MSLLPSLTNRAKDFPIFATVAQLQALSTALSTVNISTATGAGISVSEPLPNNFVFTNALSNAGGLSFVSVPGSSTLGLSNAGVVGLVAGSGIGVSGATGNITVSNSGVLSLAAGSGIGVSAGTGAITVSNSGVLSVSAGSNITLSGTASAPIINATSAALNPTIQRNQFTTSPAFTNTPAGGAPTVADTITGLTVGKVYMINIMGAIAGGSSGGSISVALTFPAIGEQVVVFGAANTGQTCGIAAAPCFPMPTTSFNIIVYGSSVGGDTVSFRLDGLTITQLN